MKPDKLCNWCGEVINAFETLVVVDHEFMHDQCFKNREQKRYQYSWFEEFKFNWAAWSEIHREWIEDLNPVPNGQ